MIRSALLIATAAACSLASAADDRPFGIGIIAGEPTGITLSYHLTDGNAINASVGWSFDGEEEFHVAIDDTFTVGTDIFNTERLDWYVGAGGRYKNRDTKKDLWGIRFPIGLSYRLEGERVEFFGEGVPVLDVSPSSTLRFNAGIGFRFYF